MPSTTTAMSVSHIRFWQHRRAVRQMLRAYPPGVDALVDQLRSTGFLARFALQQILLPLYFAREQGWAVRDQHGEMTAIMYLRRNARKGVRVLHIDDINVDARYRRQGLAERLMRHAEELARQEQRPFLKLAVTVENMPAVTLYHRLGYQDQHHRFHMWMPATAPLHPPLADEVRLRPLRQREAWKANQRFYRIEMAAAAPAVADLMVVYYPRGAGSVGVPTAGELRYAIEHGGQQIGYGDAYPRRDQWNLRLSLRPEAWGTALERQVLQQLASAVMTHAGHDNAKSLALHVPSAAHFDALSAGPKSLASELGLVAQHYDRMIMVKCLPPVSTSAS